ncbi:MAG: site-specific DNA-methyltransferase, partial [Phycisphaerae bacterium]|nr:site-specific DNA-methyltransferase [Phycisphaerae bacterium]
EPATVTDKGWQPTCDHDLNEYYFCPCTPITAHISELTSGCPNCGETMIPAYSESALTPCTVLDPFFGAGTVGLVADRLGRDCIGIELNPEYAAMAEKRIKNDAGWIAQVEKKTAEEIQLSLL